MSRPQPKKPPSRGSSAKLEWLLARLASEPGGVDLSLSELATWPDDDVAMLKRAGLVVPGSAATKIQCPGCEQACAMRVEVVPRSGRPPAVFIVCDKRSDMGMVGLAPEALERWRATREGVAHAVARLLGGSDAVAADDAGAGARLGAVRGRDGGRPVFLTWDAGGPHLRLAGHELELALVLGGMGGIGGTLTLDMRQLIRCVDAPAGVDSKPDEKPEQRRLRFVALRDEEKARAPDGCVERAAQRAGVSIFAFKQVIYRKAKPKAALEQMAATVASPVWKKTARKH